MWVVKYESFITSLSCVPESLHWSQFLLDDYSLLATTLASTTKHPRRSVYLVHFCIRETSTAPFTNPPHKVSLPLAHLKTTEKPSWNLNSQCPRCHITQNTDVKTIDYHNFAYLFMIYFFFQCWCFLSGSDTLWNLLLVLGFPTCVNTENTKIIQLKLSCPLSPFT